MKKMIALLMALCMMAMMIPAIAETAAEEGLGLDALLNLAGSAMDSSDGEGTDVNALMGMLGALGGSEDESAEPTYTAVAAESIEQFYGAWTLSRVGISGMEFPMEMLAMLGVNASGEITIAENTVSVSASFNDGSSEENTEKEADVAVEMALADGALNVTLGEQTLTFQLTDAGELACNVKGVATLFFTPAE